MKAEHQIQAACAEFMEWALPREVWWTAVDSGAFGEFHCGAALRGMLGPRLAAVVENAVRGWLARQGAGLKARGGKRGVGDFILLYAGQFVVIEVKSATGRLSPEQLATQVAVTRAGGLYVVVRSTFELEANLRELDIPLNGRHLPLEAVRA